MSNPLEVARQKRQEMKAAGIRADKHITFSGTAKVEGFEGSEVDLLEKAVKRSSGAFTSMTTFVKAAALKAALEVANKPVVERGTKTVEELQAELEKIQARIAKKAAAAGK